MFSLSSGDDEAIILNKISPWFPVRLIRELEDLLDIKVDIVTPAGLKSTIRNQVLAESLNL